VWPVSGTHQRMSLDNSFPTLNFPNGFAEVSVDVVFHLLPLTVFPFWHPCLFPVTFSCPHVFFSAGMTWATNGFRHGVRRLCGWDGFSTYDISLLSFSYLPRWCLLLTITPPPTCPSSEHLPMSKLSPFRAVRFELGGALPLPPLFLRCSKIRHPLWMALFFPPFFVVVFGGSFR